MSKSKKPYKPNAAPGITGVPPELRPQIRELWLQGNSVAEIARRTGCGYNTLLAYVATTLRPELQAAGVRHCGELLAEMRMLRAFAWDQFRKCGEALKRITEEEAFEAAAKAGKTKTTAKHLAKLVKRVTQQMPNNTARGWAGIIQWCIEQEASIAGYYKQQQGTGGEFRVAGRTADEINREMLAKLRAKIEDVRQQAALRAQFVSEN